MSEESSSVDGSTRGESLGSRGEIQWEHHVFQGPETRADVLLSKSTGKEDNVVKRESESMIKFLATSVILGFCVP